MEFSKRIEKEAQKYGVAAQSLILADLCSIGYTEADAYSIAYAENAVLNFQQNQSIRDGITKSARFKDMLNDRIENLKSRVATPDGDETELIAIDEAAREVLRAAKKLPEGSKERAELFLKYGEMLRKNQDVETEDDDTEHGVGVYLPLKCNDCPLLQDYNEKQKEIEEAKKQAEQNNTVK